MTGATQSITARLSYNRTIGVAAMQGRGFYYPWSGAISDDGRMFILARGSDSDPRGVRVTVMNMEEEYFGTFGSFGTGPGQAIWNSSIAIDSDQRLFTSDDHLNQIADTDSLRHEREPSRERIGVRQPPPCVKPRQRHSPRGPTSSLATGGTERDIGRRCESADSSSGSPCCCSASRRSRSVPAASCCPSALP